MAEVTAFRNNALPYPVYGVPYVLKFPLLDADGDPVSPSSPDSEISKNGDEFVDCTNEAVEIATSSGISYLILTGSELSADTIAIIIKSTGAKTTVFTFSPRKLVTIRAGTSASAGSSTSTVVLDASASPIDDFYNGMLALVLIDGNVEARIISDYVGSTQTATVVPDWNVAPDNTDTFIIKLPEGMHVPEVLADTVNSRNVSFVETFMPEHCLGTIILLGLKWSTVDSPGNLVIKKTGGSAFLTIPLTSDAAAEVITGAN